ncbi:MAG: glycogen synthase GlgA [Nitrospira sp.]|nr:glycogen synthase GlgA [Nitrospira sp.]
MKVLLVTSEAVPYAKTGGLADVLGALPRALAQLGHDVRLVLPKYGTIDTAAHGFKEWGRLTVPTVSGPVCVVVEEGRLPGSDVAVFTIGHDPSFARRGLYGEAGADYPDNLQRFALFCRATLELLALAKAPRWTPDVLHAHDWPAALGLVYLRSLYARRPEFTRVAGLLTVHNLGYQGLFPAAAFPVTGLGNQFFTPKTLEFYGQVNLLKGGLVFADLITTVSPTYSREIQSPEFGFGLDGVLRERGDRLAGVVNGIDVDEWNPATDSSLPARYSASERAGKKICKAALQKELGLPVRDVPLLAAISRFTAQKGLDLIAAVLPELMQLDVQVALLGTGDPPLELQFQSLRMQYPDRLGVRIGFDEILAHNIEAGADLFLMPSRYEPCGLSQLYSMRYGTVPIVRKTGGLADTVVPYTPQTVAEGRATGFVFSDATPDALLTSILLALRVHANPSEWASLIQAGMALDMSWEKSAKKYEALYRRALELRAG